MKNTCVSQITLIRQKETDSIEKSWEADSFSGNQEYHSHGTQNLTAVFTQEDPLQPQNTPAHIRTPYLSKAYFNSVVNPLPLHIEVPVMWQCVILTHKYAQTLLSPKRSYSKCHLCVCETVNTSLNYSSSYKVRYILSLQEAYKF
jgi:hypothetical protein